MRSEPPRVPRSSSALLFVLLAAGILIEFTFMGISYATLLPDHDGTSYRIPGALAGFLIGLLLVGLVRRLLSDAEE